MFFLKSRCILTGQGFKHGAIDCCSPDVGVGHAEEYLGAFGRTQEWDLPTQLSSGGLGCMIFYFLCDSLAWRSRERERVEQGAHEWKP